MHGVSAEDIGRWAIHPGGKAIVDKIQNELRLRPEQIDASRTVLRKYGNMSSVTTMFVLNELLERHDDAADNERVFAIAFGPGLTIETGVFRLMNGESSNEA
jgi:predicted naringenin-chalcone synthase